MSKFDSTELSAHKTRACAKKRKLPIKQKKNAMLKDNNNLKATPKEKLKGKLEVKMKEKKQMVVNKKKKKGKEITEGNRASHTKSPYPPPRNSRR